MITVWQVWGRVKKRNNNVGMEKEKNRRKKKRTNH